MAFSSGPRPPRRYSSVSTPVPPQRCSSVEPENDILSTRGQHLPGLLRRYTLSASPATSWVPPTHWHRMQDGGGGGCEEAGNYAVPIDDGEIGTQTFVQTRRGIKLIGSNNNPRYQWHQYYKTQDVLQLLPKHIREYYKRTNHLISRYLYIDRLLDSPLAHKLIEEYNANQPAPKQMDGVSQSSQTAGSSSLSLSEARTGNTQADVVRPVETARIKRTPRNLYRIPTYDGTPDEERPLLYDIPSMNEASSVETGDSIVKIAIWVNLIANVLLLAAKLVVMALTNSMSVLASLVDGALDFLSTAVVWITTTLVTKQDRYRYPAGRRRLEPLGVLVFSVIMVTSFGQVALISLQRLTSPDHNTVGLTVPAIAIMAGTVVVKFLCWTWCRLVKNSSVQALAQDAMTDMVFNFFSIVFPLLGTLTDLWFLDPLGGLLLSLYVIWGWGSTAFEHIRTLTGAAASPDDQSVLLYMTMRFAKLIHQIQGLEAYHAGAKLIVEVDIVLDEKTSFRDSHDLGESLQYMLESVPIVDRAFVHLDYASWNLPTHMNQQAEDDE